MIELSQSQVFGRPSLEVSLSSIRSYHNTPDSLLKIREYTVVGSYSAPASVRMKKNIFDLCISEFIYHHCSEEIVVSC
jgi:hypothetical protein